MAPDPSKALEAATKVFQKAGDTLQSINDAAAGLAKISKSAEKLDDFLLSVAAAGKNISKAAEGIDRVIKANEADIKPAVASLRQVAQKLDDTLDANTRQSLKTGVDRFSFWRPRDLMPVSHSSTRFSRIYRPRQPRAGHRSGTGGEAHLLRHADLELLTKNLRDGRGGLNAAWQHSKIAHQVRAS